MKNYGYDFISLFKCLLLVLLMAGCAAEKEKTEMPVAEEMPIRRDTAISRLNDTTFIGSVRALDFADGRLYFTLYEKAQVAQVNRALEVMRLFGSKGKGPGQMIGPEHVVGIHDSVVVFSSFTGKFELFFRGKHVQSIPLAEDVSYHGGNRFAFDGRQLFYSHYDGAHALLAQDINAGKTRKFGEVFRFDNDMQERIRNGRHILVQNNEVYAVSDNMPVIQKYSKQGKLLHTLNYGEIDFVKSHLEQINSKKRKENSYFMLVGDAYLDNEQLFLIVGTNKGEDKFSNTVLVFDAKKGENIQFSGHYYELGDGAFIHIAVEKDMLVAFDGAASELVKFVMEE